MDVDGDGEVTEKDAWLCRLCLVAAVVLAFGEKAVGLM